MIRRLAGDGELGVGCLGRAMARHGLALTTCWAKMRRLAGFDTAAKRTTIMVGFETEPAARLLPQPA